MDNFAVNEFVMEQNPGQTGVPAAAEPQPGRFSVGDAVNESVVLVKTMLFAPFSVSVWFKLGFIAFLAGLGKASLSGMEFWVGRFDMIRNLDTWLERLQSIARFMRDNPALALSGGLAAAVLVAAIAAVVQYLGARGTFMYVDNIARRGSRVGDAWRRTGAYAGSFFFWQFGLMILFSLLALGIAGAVLYYGRASVFGSAATEISRIIAFLCLIAALAPVFIVGGLVQMFMRDFVAPIMYFSGQTCGKAWGVFLEVAARNAAAVLLYVLVKAALAFVLGFTALLVCCCTCCIGLLPVLSHTVMQPLLLFNSALPMMMLKQIDDRYSIAAAGAPGSVQPPGCGGLQSGT
jgi:hypothetical protein